MLVRIINKETKVFVRDDFRFNPETEIGLAVEAAQGFIWPKWDEINEKWVETKANERPQIENL